MVFPLNLKSVRKDVEMERNWDSRYYEDSNNGAYWKITYVKNEEEKEITDIFLKGTGRKSFLEGNEVFSFEFYQINEHTVIL